MRDVQIVVAKLSHAVAVAQHMRQADRDEVAAASGLSPMESLMRGLDRSTRAWAALSDGEPLCVFGAGAASLLSDEGSPWMLGTDRLARHGRHLITLAKPYVDEMLDLHPRLSNWVDERNLSAQRWLSRIGFRLEAPAPYGVAGLPFRRFSMESANV